MYPPFTELHNRLRNYSSSFQGKTHWTHATRKCTISVPYTLHYANLLNFSNDVMTKYEGTKQVPRIRNRIITGKFCMQYSRTTVVRLSY